MGCSQSVPRKSHSHSLGADRTWDILGAGSFADDDAIAPPQHAEKAEQKKAADSKSAPAVTVTTKVEYAAIPGGQSQDVFGLVTLQAAQQAEVQSQAEQRQPLDLFCVLDVSGSMSGTNIALVQDAVRFLIREAQPQDRISIITFNHQASRELRLCRMVHEGKSEATQVVDGLRAGGGTRISSGLDLALQVAEQRRSRNPVSAILLLTDGQDGNSRYEFPALVERATRAGCSLYAFGFGVNHDAQLLSELAELAQTPFTFVEDVDQISAAFAGAVGGLSSVVAQRVEVTLSCSVDLNTVHTPFPVQRESNKAVIQIPDMLAGERRDLLVELSVPAASAGSDDTLLLSAHAKYWDLFAEGPDETAAIEMRLGRTDEPHPEMEPDAEVTTQRDRVEVARTLEEAASHGDAGRFDEAQKLLVAHEQRFRDKKVKTAISEALQVELQQAQERTEDSAAWQDGGMAELRDAMQMHKMQRATNFSVSRKSAASKVACKEMYTTSVQRSWISKCS